MAKIVRSLGLRGQRRAQRELGWNRNTIIKGTIELDSGIRCYDNYSDRSRKPFERHFPQLFDDIKAIVEPVSQVDPTFRTGQTYGIDPRKCQPDIGHDSIGFASSRADVL